MMPEMFKPVQFAQRNEVSNEEPNAGLSWKDKYVYLNSHPALGFLLPLRFHSTASLNMLFAGS